MSTNTLLKGFTLFASLLLGTTVFAGEQASTQFQQLDENQDGSLSAVEASSDTELSSAWSQVDKDGNGAIDSSEFSAFEMMNEKSGDTDSSQ